MSLGEISASKELDLFDKTTITGAIEYIICYAKNTWRCPVVFYTGARYDSQEYAAMMERLEEIKEKCDIGILDLWHSDEFNSISKEERDIYV